jgi:hypothetical protein
MLILNMGHQFFEFILIRKFVAYFFVMIELIFCVNDSSGYRPRA